MRLNKIKALPAPRGNRIALSWENRRPDLYPKVRIVRREGTYPTGADDGVTVTTRESALLFSFADAGTLKLLDQGAVSEVLCGYFHTAGVILSGGVEVETEEQGRCWIITDEGSGYCISNDLGTLSAHACNGVFDDGPGLKSETVYYYAFFPIGDDSREWPYDRANRVAAMATGPYDSAGQLFDLLPRVYHRYDAKKSDLRRFLDIPGAELDLLYSFARAALNLCDINRVDGRLLPLLAQWIGWKTNYGLEIDSQRNEIRDAPSIYQTIGLIPSVEAAVKRVFAGWESRAKDMVHNVFLTNNPEKLTIWQSEPAGEEGWTELAAPLSLDYAYEGRPAVAAAGGVAYLFYHTHKKRLWKNDGTWTDTWNIWFKTLGADGLWSPSKPLVDRFGVDKYPAAAVSQDGKIRVFWSSLDRASGRWNIRCGSLNKGVWTENDESAGSPFDNETAERWKPCAVTDGDGGLWLFWLEKEGQGGWLCKYNKLAGGTWQQPKEVVAAHGTDDHFALFHGGGGTKKLCLFLSRRDNNGKWTVGFLVKEGIDYAAEDWRKAIVDLPKTKKADKEEDKGYCDREPAALVNPKGTINLFWSSDQGGNWKVRRVEFDPAAPPPEDGWPKPEDVTSGPYSDRTPLPIPANGKNLVIFRSNRSVSRRSTTYGATETVDFRYSGSTSVISENSAKNTLMKKMQFRDFQNYTYYTKSDEKDDGKTNKKNDGFFARDAVGIYLTIGTGDKDYIEKNLDMMQRYLEEMIPIQTRPVFIYDIIEPNQVNDSYTGMKDGHMDKIPEWIWLYSCDCAATPPKYTDHHSARVTNGTPDFKYRTRHVWLDRMIEDEEKAENENNGNPD